MIEFIKKIWAWLKALLFGKEKPEPPPPEPEPLVLSFYIEEQRRAHPDKSDEELAEKYWATCTVDDSHFYDVKYNKKTGEAVRNDAGNLVMVVVGGAENELHKDDQVYVYRWAFPVDGGNVRPSVYQPLYNVNIKHFSKP